MKKDKYIDFLRDVFKNKHPIIVSWLDYKTCFEGQIIYIGSDYLILNTIEEKRLVLPLKNMIIEMVYPNKEGKNER